MKTVGIVADDYKLERFRKYLAEKGFKDISVNPFSEGVSTIKLRVRDYEVPVIKKICQRVELSFKQSN